MVGASVHRDVINTRVIGVEQNFRQLLGYVKCRGRKLDTAGIGRKTLYRAAGAVSNSVAAADRHSIGREAIGAAGGENLARVERTSVAPAIETVAFGQRGLKNDSVAKTIAGTGITAGTVINRHAAASRCTRHRCGDCGSTAGAPRRIGAYAHESNVVKVERIGSVAAGTALTRVQSPHGIVAILITAPAPVDIEQAVVVVATNHETVSTDNIAAGIEYRALLVKLIAQQSAIGSIVVKAALHSGHVGTVLEIACQRLLRGSSARVYCAGIIVLRTALHRAVIHLIGHADVIHQRRHSVDLCSTAARGKLVGHL